jgi:signal transduction histidine kinase
MYNKCRFLDWISKLGVSPGMDRLEIARIVILNRLNFAGASVAILMGVKDLLLKGPELTILPLIFLFFIGELMLAYFQHHKVARYAANILLPLLMTAVLMLYGSSNGAGYTLFVFITTAIIFHEEWVTRITLIIFIILLFSGSSITLLTYTPPLAARIDPLDAIITFIGTSVSVSLMITYFFQENQKYREEQAQLLTSLERSNAELERFAYIASHDLKTPVRNISSFLGLAERDLKRGELR